MQVCDEVECVEKTLLKRRAELRQADRLLLEAQSCIHTTRDKVHTHTHTHSHTSTHCFIVSLNARPVRLSVCLSSGQFSSAGGGRATAHSSGRRHLSAGGHTAHQVNSQVDL